MDAPGYPICQTNQQTEPVIEYRNPVVDETASTPAVADWETLYTEDNPVTDHQELIRILQDLKGRFLNQFDKPGWYQLVWLNEIYWIHISDPDSGRFDSVLHYSEHEKYNGFLRP